jgi:hypothetical protein
LRPSLTVVAEPVTRGDAVQASATDVTSLGAAVAKQQLSVIAVGLADHTSLDVLVLAIIVDGEIVGIGDLLLVLDRV